MEAPKEKSEGMTSGINQISKMGLARELGASPMNFSEQRKGFESWFKKTITIERGVKILGDGEEETRMTIVPNQNIFFQIPDGHLLFLYLTKIPLEIESIEEWKLFLGYYTHLFHNQGLLRMREIIQNNPDDLLDQLANNEVRYIMVNLFNIGKFDGKLPDDMMKRLRETSGVIEPDFRENRETWGKKRGVGALFARNIVARERPEHDIPYLDEFLCYFDGLFFRSIVTNCLLKNVPLFQSWITARSDLLADTSTQTYKLFCQIFYLSEEGMFDDEGTINVQALIKIPTDFHDALFYVERRRKERIIEERKAQEVLLEKQKNLEEKRALEEKTRNHIAAILAEKLTGLCDSDFIISLQNIPPIEKIFVTIRRGKKAIARTSCNPQDMPLDLKQCTFEVFDVAAKNTRATWENISQWKGGETYSIEVEGRIDTQGGLPTTIHTWKGEKRHRERTKREEPAHIPWRPTVVPATPGKVETILNSAPTHTPKTSLQAADPEIPKDPKESEKEDLEVALELFLEEQNSEELLKMFIGSAEWNEANNSLTLSLSKEVLADFYIPEHLGPEEYIPMLRWTGKQEKGEWILPEGTPDKIKEMMITIHKYLLGNRENETEKTRVQEIDAELCELGLQPSRRNTNTLQGVFEKMYRMNPINFDRLDIKMRDLGIREIGFRFFHNKSNSITLAKKQGDDNNNEWSITYNWTTHTFSSVGLEEDSLFQERLGNALVRFLVRIDEEMVDEMLLLNIRGPKKAKPDKIDLENGLKDRLRKGQASLFVRFQGRDILIPGISGDNYEEKIAEIRATYKPDTAIYSVYRTSSYSLLDGEVRKRQEETYNQCIENHLDMMQARCRATLAQKAHYRENTSNGEVSTQERGPFTNGVADHCREFFFKKDPFNPKDMQEFLEFIHAEATPKEKSDILLGGVINALFENSENADIDRNTCREFFFKNDPNNLDDVADFLAFLQEKGTDQERRPGEKHVGIVYNSPVIGPVSDIARILAKKKKE